MFKSVGIDAFSIIGQCNAPGGNPSVAPPGSSPSAAVATVPIRAQQFNDFSRRFNEPQSQYVMTEQQALNLIAKAYPGEIKVTDNEKITYWQAAKHIYHGKGVGVDPEMYGMTQKQLMEISKRGGLTAYVRKGYQLPSIGHVRAYQDALKNICICENSQKRTDSKYYYQNGVTSTTAYYDEKKIHCLF